MITEIINTISDEELESINLALVNRYGMDFTGYEASSLKRRIARIIHKHNFNSVIELWQKLLYSPEFVPIFKDEISVGLTEMFRNPELWTFLRDQYLDRFNSAPDLKILHAGCSTGEEYYTMAIVLYEAGLLPKTSSTVVDLSDRFVAATSNGCFDSDNFPLYEKNYRLFSSNNNPLGKYFSIENEQYCAMPFLKKPANFKQCNLVSDTVGTAYDIIFCRNVMIYFNDALKMKVLEKFSSALKDDGILIIGYFDAMPSNYGSYFQYYEPSYKIFKKI